MIQLTATQYRGTLESGHSRPCLIEGETSTGNQCVVVLKLRNSVIGMGAGLARELVASQFASALGLQTPEPCMVEILPEFVESIPDSVVRSRFSSNLGIHYGSVLKSPGWHAVSYGTKLPNKLIDPAARVLGFDALIGNDDRHQEKTNYLIKGSEVIIIDHERAFPPGRPRNARPWEEGGLEFLKRHAFFLGLKSQMPDFEPLETAFESVSPDHICQWVAAIPDQWNGNGTSQELKSYLMTLREKSHSILESAKILLR